MEKNLNHLIEGAHLSQDYRISNKKQITIITITTQVIVQHNHLTTIETITILRSRLPFSRNRLRNVRFTFRPRRNRRQNV